MSIPPTGRTRIVASGPDAAIAWRGRLLVSIWRTEVTTRTIAAIDRSIASALPSFAGQGYGSITVLEPTVSMRIPDDARDASTALQRRYAEEMKCSAYLVDGIGFLSAAVRTVTAGMALVTRAKYPIKVFPDTTSCVNWVAPVVGLATQEVEQAIKRGAQRPLSVPR